MRIGPQKGYNPENGGPMGPSSLIDLFCQWGSNGAIIFFFIDSFCGQWVIFVIHGTQLMLQQRSTNPKNQLASLLIKRMKRMYKNKQQALSCASLFFKIEGIERNTAAMQIGIRLILTTTHHDSSPPGVCFFLRWAIEYYSLWWNIEYFPFTNLAQCKNESQLRAASWYKKELAELLIIGDSSHTQP